MIRSMTARLALLYSATALATIITLELGLFIGLQNNISRDEAMHGYLLVLKKPCILGMQAIFLINKYNIGNLLSEI